MVGSCGTVCHNRKEIYGNFSPKHSKLKKGDTVSKVCNNLTAICWKDKRGINALKHISSPANGNFLDEHGNATEHHIIEKYNTHMGYVDRSDRMTKMTMSNSYGICHHTWKCIKKLFLRFLELSVLKAFLLHKPCGGDSKPLAV
jgi:hypothetical protein